MSRALVVGVGIGMMYADVLKDVVDDVVIIDTLQNKHLEISDNAKFDIAIISTPNFLHEHYASVVADRGLSNLIVVDKPGFKNAASWSNFIQKYPDIRLQMVKNNLFRDSIRNWRDIFESDPDNVLDVRWHNNDRVPKPGSWFTTQEMSFGGVEVDLLPHLINILYAVRGDLPHVSRVKFEQNWKLEDLKRSDYGEVKTDGVYDVSDFTEVVFADGSIISADWRTLNLHDDIAIRIYDASGALILHEELGLCPCYAYGKMFKFMIDMNEEQHIALSKLDLQVHHIIHDHKNA